MKSKRSQRHAGPGWQGKGVNTGDKTALIQAKPTNQPSQVKPFAGKVFYLDLPSNRTAEKLESDIKELGGTVEKFFSKEIKYLVSNKRDARYVQCLKQDSPVPSPDSGQSSPHPQSNPHRPGSHRDNIKSRSQGQMDTFVTSRGKSLVGRVVKEQERVQINQILSNALEWGVKIFYINDVMAYVQKKKKIARSQCSATTAVKVKTEPAAKHSSQKFKGVRISKPFVKVEDSSRQYRPIYLNMPNMPEFNLKTVPPFTPFCVDDKDPSGNKRRGYRDVKGSASEERAHGRKRNRDRERSGYCECCMIKYENLTMHLKSERHKVFSKSDNYFVVDRLVSTLPCSFVHIKTAVKRPKCSVSSVVVATGPCGKTKPRHKRDLDTTETLEQELQWAVDRHQGNYSGHTSAPCSMLLIHREGDWKSSYSDTSKNKSLVCKRLCRQNSLTSSSLKAEQAQIPQLKKETAPSKGECLGSVPSRVTQVDAEDQISHKDTKGSAILFGNMNGVSSKEEDKNKDLLLFEADQDRNVFPEKNTGNNRSENEEGSFPAQSFSPVQKIRRKVKVYKRIRRKVDTHFMHVKPSDDLDSSISKLWELFQSSDEDMEFHGFDN